MAFLPSTAKVPFRRNFNPNLKFGVNKSYGVKKLFRSTKILGKKSFGSQNWILGEMFEGDSADNVEEFVNS